jgi:type IV pilus assembly protein PilP
MSMSDSVVSRLSRIALLGVALGALAGCTPGDADLRDWVAKEKAQKGAPIPPLPVLKTFETFEYTDQGMRDPFSPSLEEGLTNSGPQPDKHPKEPLEAYALDSLRMVGTIGTGPTIEGLIKDTEGTVHRVHKGNYMGQNNGKIVTISDTKIDLVELIPNGTGGWMERHAAVALPEK